MGKYIPIDQRSEDQIRTEIDREFDRWNHIAQNGCSDPFWPDGVNMNLIRNHIIYFYTLLQERRADQRQMSLFDCIQPVPDRPVPPEVPDNYMVADGQNADRVNNLYNKDVVWGRKGQYKA